MDEIQGLLAELTSGEDERAEAAVSGLAGLGEAALALLRDLMRSPNPDHRWWAVRALAALENPQTPPLLTEALRDEAAAVRQCAALGLRERPHPQAIPALAASLSDPDPLCATLAGDALIAIGSPAVDALLEVMHNGPQAARLRAVRALAIIGDQRAIPILFAAVKEDSALMEYWASEGLDRMGLGMTFFEP